MIQEMTKKVVEGNNLTASEAEQVMNEIMDGEATDAQKAAFLTALNDSSVKEIVVSKSVVLSGIDCDINKTVTVQKGNTNTQTPSFINPSPSKSNDINPIVTSKNNKKKAIKEILKNKKFIVHNC